MSKFNNKNFLMCGKTVGSLRRNVIFWCKLMMVSQGYQIKEIKTKNLLVVSKGDVINYFYIFGGKDEGSQDLIQGITAAGAFFDEVALMQESFVNQATGRCSVEDSKFWFNCNPECPNHWFKINCIDKMKEKNLVYLHFTMDDNFSLSEKIKERYRSMYQGLFYKRYILGLWYLAEGLIYDLFEIEKHTAKINPAYIFDIFYVSCDYGTQNPSTFGLWRHRENKWYKIKEYYYSSCDEKKQKTDSQFADDFENFIKGINIKAVIVDPIAASFIAELRSRKIKVIQARNDVLDGIETVATLIQNRIILISESCEMTIREFQSYTWDKKAADKVEDKPVKENDHCMDETIYFCYTILDT